jgi:short-subunit dehydrogenase
MRTCVITGASSGIGKATFIELFRRKQFENFVIVGRQAEELNILCETLNRERNGSIPNIFVFVFDLENLFGISELIENIIKRTTSIDAIVNAAGFTEPAALIDTSIENTLKTYTINVFSMMEIIRHSIVYLKKTHGKILNIASTAGMTPRPGWISYSSSKAAVISISNTLSQELSEYGIKVYCISPGRCATPLRMKLAPDEDFSKIMQPEDVAKHICYLLSKNEMCLDGQNIVVRKQVNN